MSSTLISLVLIRLSENISAGRRDHGQPQGHGLKPASVILHLGDAGETHTIIGTGLLGLR